MRVGSLFTGIGGFDLAATWAGMSISYQVENDPFCNQVLEKRFPNVPKYGDIRSITNGHLPKVDILCGGFPCQPFSVAGHRRGAEDDRALWKEMLRIIKDTKPTWAIGENVPGIISMELDNIVDDLENAGYETQTLVIPACAVGAQHIRSRVWILAHTNQDCKSGSTKHDKKAALSSDTDSIGQPGQGTASSTSYSTQIGDWEAYGSLDDRAWRRYIEAGVCRGTDGIPHGMDRLRGLGNAIVPHVAYILFKYMQQIELDSSLRWSTNNKQHGSDK